VLGLRPPRAGAPKRWQSQRGGTTVSERWRAARGVDVRRGWRAARAMYGAGDVRRGRRARGRRVRGRCTRASCGGATCARGDVRAGECARAMYAWGNVRRGDVCAGDVRVGQRAARGWRRVAEPSNGVEARSWRATPRKRVVTTG